MKQLFTLIVILQFVCQNSSVFAEEDKSSTVAESDNNMIVLHLDDKMNKILLDLFVDVFGNNPDNSSDYKIELPMSAVAELYHNYTQEQLNSLRTELKKLDNRFDIVRQRVDSLQKTFLLANIEYALTKNLSQYERHFIHIGENVITLQKLVLKFTNGEKPIDINSINRNGRKSVIGTVFDKLARLLLGVTTESTDSQQNSQFLSSNQLNKLAILMRSLQSLKNVSTEQLNPKIRSDVTRLQTMLYRLQQIQELNRLSQERTFLHSSNMNPYGYEAILNLVKIMGTGSGQNQLRALLRLFTTPMTTTKVKPNNRLSHEKIRTLMRALEEQEKQRRQQLETQRQKQILEELLMNQRRQQEQIDSLIRLIQSQNKHTTNHNNMNEENNHHNHQSNHNGNSNGNNKGYNEHQSHHNNHNNHNENNHQTQSHKNVSPTMNINEIFDNHMNNIWQNQRTSTTTHRPTTSANQNEILNKLREQRRQLNNLLKTLGTDFNTNQPTKSPAMSGTNHNLGQTHETFTNILKTIGPMIGSLAQSGLVPHNQVQVAQNTLSDLLNQKHINNRIQYDSYKSKASQLIDLLGSILNF